MHCPMNIKTFETSETTRSTARHIPEDSYLQPNRCENPKYSRRATNRAVVSYAGDYSCSNSHTRKGRVNTRGHPHLSSRDT